MIVEGNSVLTNEAGWVGITTNVAGLWSPPVAVETGAGSPVSVTVPMRRPARAAASCAFG
jgi:hypothetical protein